MSTTHNIYFSYRYKLLYIALFLLGFGFLIYILFRPCTSEYAFGLISPICWLSQEITSNLNIVTGRAPSLVHAFSLSIITSLIFPKINRSIIIASCVFWVVINLLFELGQLFKPQFTNKFNNSYADILMNKVNLFLYQGTYDPWDVLAAITGGAIAYYLLVYKPIE